MTPNSRYREVATGTRWRMLVVLLCIPAPVTASQDATGPTPRPTIQLAPPDGFDDSDAFVFDARQQAEMLAAMADAPDRERAQNLLDAASLSLAKELEPVCAQLVHCLLDREAEQDRIAEILNRAATYLARCASLLKDRQRTDEPNGVDNAWSDIQRRYRTVRAFKAALYALLMEKGDSHVSDEQQEVGDASTQLAILLESDEPRLSSAAALWQAYLRRQDGRIDAAMRMLPLALAPPRSEAQPYALFSRILHCELIAQNGGDAAATALLVQLEDQCSNWFPDTKLAQQARTSVLWSRFRVLESWRDRSGAEQDSVERAWFERQLHALREDIEESGGVLLRFVAAVPLEERRADGGSNP